MTEGFGHGERLVRHSEHSAEVCGAPHPLIKDVACDLPVGHTGRHEAHRDAATIDIVLRWWDEEPSEE